MGKVKLDNRLEAIFKELDEKAYNSEFHNYNYKCTNQVVRKHFEALLCDGKSAVITESKCNKHIVNGSISAGDAIMAILDWMKSDDCWIEDKNGNKVTDVEICGRFNPKYLEKYYR